MMAHHLQKVPVEVTLLAGEHGIDRRSMFFDAHEKAFAFFKAANAASTPTFKRARVKLVDFILTR